MIHFVRRVLLSGLRLFSGEVELEMRRIVSDNGDSGTEKEQRAARVARNFCFKNNSSYAVFGNLSNSWNVKRRLKYFTD